MYYRAKKIVILILLHAFLLSVALSCIYPLIWMLNVSVKTEDQFRSDYGMKLSVKPDFNNYKTVIFEGKLGSYFINSIFYTFITVFFIVIISSLAAYAFARLNFPGKNAIFFMFLAAMMIPLPAGFVPIYILLNKFFIFFNTTFPFLQKWAIAERSGYVAAMTNMGLSLSIYLLKTFFDQLPRDLEDAAKIDGCNRLQIWWNVGLPLVAPALAVVIIFNAMTVWNEFVLASLMFTEDKLMPLQVGLMEIYNRNIIQHTLIMAALALAALPIILLYLKMQKQIIKGLTAGAVVG
ncbi:MAG: carbohydrate ABC transporter permease [Candidatus Omnitrophica bacterium]|nr:carbohydrate ABC transporter permease [Candidatus Omnitrophota bacterium]